MTTKWKIKNRFLSMLLALVLVFSMMPITSMTAFAATAVSYIDRSWDGSKVVSSTKSCTDYTVITSSTTSLSAGWYVVNQNVTFDRLTTDGNVNIILVDGYTLTAENSIYVKSGTLTIYGQTKGTGKIDAKTVSTSNAPALGGHNIEVTIIINGGIIEATANNGAAAIGGSESATKAINVTINGGTVNATSSANGAAIGTGYRGKAGNITINGGTVTAKSTGSYGYAPAIGNPYTISGGKITINGCSVTASTTTNGRYWAPAIGHGCMSQSKIEIEINGGTINATTANSSATYSIGGNSTFTVNGGNIYANKGIGSAQNSDGNAVTLNTITLNGAKANTNVTSVSGVTGYGLNDVKTLNTNKLYFYLPSNSNITGITAGSSYICNRNLTFYTSHNFSAATCTSPKTCECGQTEGSINASNHSWGNWTTNGNGTHTRKCTLNEAHTETENCSGGTASCTDKAVCSVCQSEYGSVSGHSYQYTANGNVITETCKNNCGHNETATLKADNSVSLVYDGSARKPLTVEYSDGWVGDKTAKITYTDDCIGVGKHTGSITIGGVTATQDFNISQAQNSWNTEPSISGWTYGESANIPNKGTPKFGSVTKVEYKPATADDSEYSTTVPTQAGNYKARFTVEGNANYTSLTKEIEFEIEKVKLTVKADDKSKIYGETDPTLTWKITSGALVGYDTLSNISVIRENGEDVKTYTINAGQTAGANPNYNITFETGTFTINKKTIGISWGNRDFTYDGGTKLPIATATGMVFNDEIELTVTGGQINAGAGYTATVTGITGNKKNNYQLPADVTTTFTVAKADQIAPSGLDYKAETIDEKADGYIKNLTADMEYRKNDETTYTAITGTELTGLADGTYYIRYKEDSNHNASPDTTVVLSNDTKLIVTVPTTQTGYTLTVSNNALKWNESTTITFALHEGYSELNNFAVKVNVEPITLDNNGKYTIANVQEDLTVTVEGVADITAPDTEITLGTNKWNRFFNNITFGLFFKDTQKVTVTANDKGSGVDKIYYYLSATELTEEQVKALSSDKWTEYTGEFNLNPQDEYIIYAKAVDKDNNAKYISSEQGVVIDSIAPEISDIADGETHYGDTTFTVTDKHIDVVKVDGQPITLTEGKYTITADGKEHTVVATDKSGNASAEIKITVITIASLDDSIENITTDNVKSSDKQDIQDVLDFVNGLITGGKDFTDAEDTQLADIKANTEVLLNKIASVSAEMSDLDSSVKAYDVDKVKSDDKTAINELIARIDTLLNGNNLTDNDKAEMTALKTTAQSLIKRIDDIASKVSGLTDKVNAYDKDKVKSTDKDTINGLIEEMTALINGNNLNDSEKENLGNIKTTAESLIKKIDDTADEIKAITDSVNGYNKDTVKSDDKQDIENLIKRIDTLTGTDNVTESEKTALEEVKSTANDLIKKIDDTASDVKDLTDTVNGYDKDKVTSDDKKNIEDLIDEIDKLLDGDNLNDSEKEELGKVKDTANGLVDKINEAADSSKTENTDKVKDTTADNVKTEDKKDLEKAKDDLEKALDDYKDNLTDDEKKDIEKEIERIEDALQVIEKVEDVEDLINKLPDTITKADADAIKKADDAYNALTKYEQSILDKDAKKKLDNAKSALEALNKETTSPATGDTGNIWMWFALLFVSGGGVLGTTVCRRKRKETEN